jgi:cell division septum initiation protein DivIVA
MQTVRSMTWRPLTVTAFGLALICAWVAALLALTVSQGYETSAPLLLIPVLVALSLPALMRQAHREESATLLWLLVAALLLKLGSALVRHYVAFDLYGGAADAAAYHQRGVELSEAFRDGNFHTGLYSLTSTNFIRFLTGVVYTVIGPSRLGGFLFYSWLGFWGLFFFYRAFAVAVPEGRPRSYGRLVLFLPSLLFWPSGIGKEAWMMFALGIAAYGAARVLSGATLKGLAGAALGLWLAALVRPHVAGMMALALAAAYLLRPSKRELRQLAPLAKTLALSILALAALYLILRTDRFLTESGIDTAGGVSSVLTDVGERTSSGGSEFDSGLSLGSPSRAFLGIGTVLFRPFPFEAHNLQALAASLEGVFLLLLLVRLPWALAAMRSWRRQPYVVFALAYVGMFVVAFSTVANFGLLARQRVQLLPMYLVLFSIPPRKEAEMASEQSHAYTPGGGERSKASRFRPKRSEVVGDEIYRDGQVAHLQALETRVRELEATLRQQDQDEDTSAHQETHEMDPAAREAFWGGDDRDELNGPAARVDPSDGDGPVDRQDPAEGNSPTVGVEPPDPASPVGEGPRRLHATSEPAGSSQPEDSDGVDEFRGIMASRIAEALRCVDHEAERLQAGAQEEAQRIVDAARSEAQGIREETLAMRAEARAILHEARARAGQADLSIAQQRKQTVADLERLRALIASSLEDLNREQGPATGGSASTAAGPAA